MLSNSRTSYRCAASPARITYTDTHVHERPAEQQKPAAATHRASMPALEAPPDEDADRRTACDESFGAHAPTLAAPATIAQSSSPSLAGRATRRWMLRSRVWRSSLVWTRHWQ